MKIGHRGAMGYAPENTLKSFKKALELNVDAVELDIYVCKSGELVVIHDDKVNRTTNGKGYVVEKTFEELSTLDAGEGEKIPKLSEVLDLIDRKVKVNIELKGVKTAKPVHELIEKYVKNKGWEYDDFLISSFNHYELKKFRKLNPKIKIGALISGIPIGFSKFAKMLNVDSVNLCFEFINQEFVDDAHNRNLKVYVWTVNDSDDIERMKTFGVDGIFSNFPDRL
ncbi:MAG TPA: glycerophosphodiester phosphodiesterase [Nanoarchaeota archaeon]|nr:glycerophosphodiester phosphodiesterase [Nanoarchaeota archaeon]HIH62920.1 glycerophosphodiester phosphodiesterase [Nanoarchaeota archaeon]HIJ10337.1 glycerophosphodiester phosphodiesterase [Nanoarchaeota archaeon]